MRVISISNESGRTAEETLVYCARVSSSKDTNDKYEDAGLIKYLIKNKHWSPFETISVTLEFETSLAVATQILRHRSFTFQQFSMRYAEATDVEIVELRRKGSTNRQSSIEVDGDFDFLEEEFDKLVGTILKFYQKMLDCNVAAECARMILPQCTRTKMYMTGSLRSWLHYLDIRTEEHVQKEHRVLAEEMRSILETEFPKTFKAFRDCVKTCCKSK